MKRFLWALALGAVSNLTAQETQRPSDSVRAELLRTERAERLRAQIERRFGELVHEQLGLTADQAQKLKGTQENFGERRRGLMREQFETRQALQRQMRPGEAANPDSVRVLMHRLQRGREQMLKLEQEEDREMAGYLTPVQRARFQMMRQRFMERVEELRRGRDRFDGPRRRPGPGGRRPGRTPAD